MRLLRRLFLLSCALALLAAPARAEEARITLLHTTDLHGALTAYDDLADRPANRGLVKIATLVSAARREGPPVLLLDAGDATAGSPLVTVWHQGDRARPDPMITAMNRLGYDAMAVGNHEFDFGLPELARERSLATFRLLGANVLGAYGRPAFDASLVKTLGGVRIGVVGLCTPAVPSMVDSALWAGLTFESPVDAAKREVARLRTSEHCDVIVLLAHTGLERDPVSGVERQGDAPDENWGYRLANEVPGVDVVILGHTHAVVPFAEVNGVQVTQAGKWGENLGRVDLRLARDNADAAWKLVSKRANVLAVSDSTASDPELAAFAEPYATTTRGAIDQPIATATRELSAPRGRFEDNALLELVQHAQLAASGADVSLASLFDPAIRIPRGAISVRDALRLYPYDNTLGVVELTGAQLKDVLEQSARTLAEYTYEDGHPLAEPGMPAYNFDVAEGVTYEVDLTRPAGDRIQHLSFQNAPLAAERTLKVAVNSYRLNGGGGFEALRSAPRRWASSAGVRQLLIEDLRKRQSIDGGVDRNWTLVPDYAPTLERPLIDRLVRLGVAPREEVNHLIPDEPARRGDVAYWLGRAWGWRAKRLSGAFADVPDSLEPWLDGVLQNRVLGRMATAEYFDPFRIAPLSLALLWSERAARAGGARLQREDDPAFRRSLTTGLSVSPGSARRDTLTRAQVLGIVANARFPVIRVLETTDVHGAILAGGRERRTGRVLGSSPVLAAWVEKLRAENPEGTVLLDGGDWFQGTMISNLEFGRPIVEQMNALGYTAAAIGNHEFDWTADTLARRIDAMHFAALGANMIERKGGRRPRWARSDTSFVRRGVPIGVFGLCYPGTPRVTLPANVAHLRFEDDSVWAARLAPKLRKAGAWVVLEVGHIPAESDSTQRAREGDLLRLARGVRGVDAWFGGHSHNLVSDRVGDVPLMIAGSHGQWLAVADLTVDPVKRRVVERRTRLQPTYADEVTPDSVWIARVARWNADVGRVAAMPLGRNVRTLRRDKPESTIGNFITDAMRAATGVDVALQNPGGMRADMNAGAITKGDVYEVMPFDNTIVTMEITGAELKQALEQALRSDRITQVSGIRYAFDPSKPAMQRVVNVTRLDGAPLDPTATYKVAANNFMATGGDNYDALGGGRNKTDTGLVIRGAMEQLVTERSKNGGALDYAIEGRITRVGAN